MAPGETEGRQQREVLVMTQRRDVLGWLVCVLTAAGLAVDAYVHLHLAPTEAPGYAGHLGENVLFYIEGAVSIAAALLVLVTRARWAYLVAAIVAATAFGAVVLYRYVDVGALGPMPDMYEPVWYFQKSLAAIAEAAALVFAVVGVLIPRAARVRTVDRAPVRTSAE
jgi:hypothetical protein